MNYYTLQIHYGSSLDMKIEERKDLNSGTMNEAEWVRQLRERLFITGFHVVAAPGTYEFITPFKIHKVYLIKQAGKIGI